MKILANPFRFALLALALPAALTFSSCGDDDDDNKPAPAQGKVTFVNAASHVAPANLKFLVDNSEKASLDYGRTSGYQNIQAGGRALKVMAGTQTAVSQSINVEQNRNYTFLATPAASASMVGALLVPDDLTAPSARKARIRVINVGQDVPTAIKLSQVTSTAGGPVVVDIVANVAANTASAFVEFMPANYGLTILDNSGTTLAEVGDGSGSGMGTKNYEAGKIYTVVVSGTPGSISQEQRVKAFLSQNN